MRARKAAPGEAASVGREGGDFCLLQSPSACHREPALTYALFLVHTAHLHHADLNKLYRLIYENDELVNTLSLAKRPAEAANQATPMNGVIGMLRLEKWLPRPRVG